MPMGPTDEHYGTEVDGSKSKDYCHYCYENGAFTSDCTLQQMIEICVAPMVADNPGMSEKDARTMMQTYLPNLKRWKQA